MNGNKLFN